MQKQFNDNKQLILTMYNIAVMGSLIIIVSNVVEVYQGIMRIFVAVGVFWTTVFSSCVFVLPRLLQVHARSRESRDGRSRQSDDNRWSRPKRISAKQANNVLAATAANPQANIGQSMVSELSYRDDDESVISSPLDSSTRALGSSIKDDSKRVSFSDDLHNDLPTTDTTTPATTARTHGSSTNTNATNATTTCEPNEIMVTSTATPILDASTTEVSTPDADDSVDTTIPSESRRNSGSGPLQTIESGKVMLQGLDNEEDCEMGNGN